jgi:hypothetical protein
MQTCPTCKKVIPARDRYCVYCGSQLPRALPLLGWGPGQARVAGAPQPSLAEAIRAPRTWLGRNRLGTMAVIGGLLGAGVGGVLGQAFGNVWLGGLAGAAGAGAATAVGEGVAGPLPDRRSAERFGLVIGALGGLLALPVGVIVTLGVLMLSMGWAGLSAYFTQLTTDLTAALTPTIAGTIVGTVTGALAGYYLALTGYRLGRRGAIAGAALAWTLAAVLAGLVTADQAAQSELVVDMARSQAAALGILLQVGGGAALLALMRGWLGRLRRWWVGRP